MLIGWLQLEPGVAQLAAEYWFPRALGGGFAISLWGVTGFFNGIGRTRVTLLVMTFVAVVNAVLNELFIFRFGWGIAGAGWATTAALAAGNVLAVMLFTSRPVDLEFASRRAWRSASALLPRLLRVGF